MKVTNTAKQKIALEDAINMNDFVQYAREVLNDSDQVAELRGFVKNRTLESLESETRDVLSQIQYGR